MNLAIQRLRLTTALRLAPILVALFAVGVAVQCSRAARFGLGRATALARARLRQGFDGEGRRGW